MSLVKVEMHPFWQQKKLRKYCKEKAIKVCAYSPLGAKGTPWGGNLVMDSEVLQQIAKRVGKSLAQVGAILVTTLILKLTSIIILNTVSY